MSSVLSQARETRRTILVRWKVFLALNLRSSLPSELAVSSSSWSSSSSSSYSSSFAREPASTRSPGARLPCRSALWPRPKEPPSPAQNQVTSSSPCGQQRITTVRTMKKWAGIMGTPSTLFRKCPPRAQPISTTKSEGKGREVTAIRTCFCKVSWIFFPLPSPVCYMSEMRKRGARKDCADNAHLEFPFFWTLHCVYVCLQVSARIYAKQQRTPPQCVWHSGTNFSAEEQPLTDHRGTLDRHHNTRCSHLCVRLFFCLFFISHSHTVFASVSTQFL